MVNYDVEEALKTMGLEKLLKYSYLNLELKDFTNVHNQLTDMDRQAQYDNPVHEFLDFMRQPENFAFTCKWLLNIDLLPFQGMILEELWKRKFPMLIMTRGGGKTWILSLYSLLRALFCPGSKIILVGAAFRQSKILFEYIETFWRGAPILRNIVGTGINQGPKRDTDRCSFYIGDSVIHALPIGTGEKIRGMRSNFTIADEFDAIPPEIFDVVIRGFGSVHLSPVDKVKKQSNLKIFNDIGMTDNADKIANETELGNQVVISGTAGYSFKHFYQYWQKYCSIINSEGDTKILEEIFQGSIPDDFNWSDYGVIRMPYQILPDGLMDKKSIAQARALMNTELYKMEYAACVGPDTDIITDYGLKKITDINMGDMVLTHKGRFRPVIKKTFRKHTDKIYKIRTYGYNQDILVTHNHPFVHKDSWKPIKDIDDKLRLSSMAELNNKESIDMTDYCNNYKNLTHDRRYIYAQSSQSKLSNDNINYILSSTKSVSTIADELNVNTNTICDVIKAHKTKKYFKSCIPKIIPLNYQLGLIIGYYLAEGSIGANGRATAFALDGHKNFTCNYYVRELSDAIKNIFEIEPKLYYSSDNTCNVTINNRLVCDLMSKICPGNCYNKYCDPAILFSNADFMLGALTGFWNGDGCIHFAKSGASFATASVTSKLLINQVKLILIYFNINSALYYKTNKSQSVIKGKLVNQADSFSLDIHSDNFSRFMKICYDLDIKSRGKSWKVATSDSMCEYSIKEKEIIDYDGFVYNLEIEEDNSYSLPCATVHNCFADDSNGFYKRSLIERCVTKEPISKFNGPVQFRACISGLKGEKYVYGIDPASETDNFSIVILEVHPDHRRIVYCWTVNRAKLRERLKKVGKTTEESFYNYCAGKIRQLMKVFPTEHIAIDKQGGGVAIIEALQDTSRLNEHEHRIWPYTVQGKNDPFWWEETDKVTDSEPGLHIIHECQFANSKFIEDANHGMRKDFETQDLLFPLFDTAEIGLSIEQDSLAGREYDTLEDCVLEIEELKNELTQIVHTSTTTGRDKWDTPEIKAKDGRKGKLRKDRYSALLIANMIARTIDVELGTIKYNPVGGYVGGKTKDKDGPMYNGPDHLIKKMGNYSSLGGCSISR